MIRAHAHILSGLFLFSLVLLGSQAIAAGPVQEWRFKVYLDDKWIGYHNFRLTPRDNGRHTLDIDASFDVKFLFINAYSYRHQNTEQWQRQCLRSIRSRTDDNGKRFDVTGSTIGSRFHLDNGSERTTLSDCVMTFAYWDPAILGADRLLNAQTGEYVDVTFIPMGRDLIAVRDQNIAANRYRLISDQAVIDLWYAESNSRWLALQSTTDSGRKLRYLMD
ncbi:MAG: DUF6134 family protein [Acidiferrobacterales bacterium]|jgi:hypothetical protein|nr:DUF6134 family protein [Acidiferrobacterales bacterium]